MHVVSSFLHRARGCILIILIGFQVPAGVNFVAYKIRWNDIGKVIVFGSLLIVAKKTTESGW